jgi:hypothetical protein
MAKNMLETLEQQEIIQKLIDNGYGELVDAFLSNESSVYTRKGRLNKSGACRVLGKKAKQLEDMLEACRAIFGESLD